MKNIYKRRAWASIETVFTKCTMMRREAHTRHDTISRLYTYKKHFLYNKMINQKEGVLKLWKIETNDER